MRFSFLPNKIELIASIEFDWVRLSSIDFWFGSSIPDSKFQIPVQLRTSPLFLRLASNAFPDIESVGPGADYSWSVGLEKKKKTKKKNHKKSRNRRPRYPSTTLKVKIHIFGLTKRTIHCEKCSCFCSCLFFSMLLLCSLFRLR